MSLDEIKQALASNGFTIQEVERNEYCYVVSIVELTPRRVGSFVVNTFPSSGPEKLSQCIFVNKKDSKLHEFVTRYELPSILEDEGLY